MKLKSIIILITVFFTGLFIFRNVILYSFTKNWKKKTFTYETTDYEFELAINEAKGCVKGGIEIQNDTVIITNFNLDQILRFLTRKNLNDSEIIGFNRNRHLDYNFYYYPKSSNGKYINDSDDILKQLGLEFGFTHDYDSVQKKVYIPVIYDMSRIKEYATTDSSGFVQYGKDYIKFNGNTLAGIFNSCSRNIKDLIIESNFSDSLFYSFTIQSREKEDVLLYFKNEFGIIFTESEKNVELLTIRF